MVFWSSFAKKIKQSVSQISFDALKARVTNVEQINNNQDTEITSIKSTLQTNSTNIVNLNNVKADKTALEVVDNKVDGVITGLQNGNIVNYTGTYNSATTYNIGQCVTYQNKWYVSNVNNNVGHNPTGASDSYWELLSEPTINLNPYLTKTEATNTYLNKTDASTNYLLKNMLNTMFPVGSNVMTTDGSEHALVTMYRSKFKELTDSDLAYLAIGSGTASNTNTGSFMINTNNLPNIYWAWNVDWNNGITSGETNLQTYVIGGSARMDISNTKQQSYKNSTNANNSGARLSVMTKIYLNGNVAPIPISYTMKPKTLKIRMWQVTANLI